MPELPTLSEEERSLILWCRWVRDWPVPSFAWGEVRGMLYSAAITAAFVAGLVWVGLYSPERLVVDSFW
jgi:hypothetical protein